jgi:ATP-dependent DNA helicase 2 subunit 2
MVENAESEAKIEEAVRQMGAIVRQLITDSMGDNNYDRVVENLGRMRHEMIDMEEPGFYNTFLTDLKKRILSGELGGDRRELWWQIKGARLGLIDHHESEMSKVNPEEAAKVCFSLSQFGRGSVTEHPRSSTSENGPDHDGECAGS